MFRIFPWQIFFLIKRIFHLPLIFGTIIFKSIRIIPLQKQMRIQIGSGLRTDTETESINIIIRNHCIDRADVHLTGMLFRTRFDKILNECFRNKYDIFESGNLFQTFNKYIHCTFRLSQRNLSGFRPKFLSFHHGIRFLYFLSFLSEQLCRQRIKRIIRIFGSTSDLHPLQCLYKIKLSNHIIILQSPFSRRQLLIFLNNIQVVYKVHTCFLRQIHYTFLYCISRIIQNI